MAYGKIQRIRLTNCSGQHSIAVKNTSSLRASADATSATNPRRRRDSPSIEQCWHVRPKRRHDLQRGSFGIRIDISKWLWCCDLAISRTRPTRVHSMSVKYILWWGTAVTCVLESRVVLRIYVDNPKIHVQGGSSYHSWWEIIIVPNTSLMCIATPWTIPSKHRANKGYIFGLRILKSTHGILSHLSASLP